MPSAGEARTRYLSSPKYLRSPIPRIAQRLSDSLPVSPRLPRSPRVIHSRVAGIATTRANRIFPELGMREALETSFSSSTLAKSAPSAISLTKKDAGVISQSLGLVALQMAAAPINISGQAPAL